MRLLREVNILTSLHVIRFYNCKNPLGAVVLFLQNCMLYVLIGLFAKRNRQPSVTLLFLL